MTKFADRHMQLIGRNILTYQFIQVKIYMLLSKITQLFYTWVHDWTAEESFTVKRGFARIGFSLRLITWPVYGWNPSICYLICSCIIWSNMHRDHSVHAPSLWESALHRNAISQWLVACTEWSLIQPHFVFCLQWIYDIKLSTVNSSPQMNLSSGLMDIGHLLNPL